MRIPGLHFRHKVSVYRLDPDQEVDPDFGETDGPGAYVHLGDYRAYVRFLSDEDRVIGRAGEELEGDGKAVFRPDDLRGLTLQTGDRLLIDGQFAYEVSVITPRAPQAGGFEVVEATFRRFKKAPDQNQAEITSSINVA